MESAAVHPFFKAPCGPVCSVGATCEHAVVDIGGRYFIAAGHAGFNNRTNNRNGFKTQKAARASIARYAGRQMPVAKWVACPGMDDPFGHTMRDAAESER